MQSDNHKPFQQLIDEMLASGTPIEQNRFLGEHLHSCASCAEYLNISSRAIASLGGFSFAVDPMLQEKVFASLSQRAQQLEGAPRSRPRWALISVAAVALTLGGSFIDLQFGGVIASVFDIQRMQVRQGLLAFWIVPSLCILLLFPLLPLLSKASTYREERTL
jgi:predicted anti-sigma-YlaC factor YlaD